MSTSKKKKNSEIVPEKTETEKPTEKNEEVKPTEPMEEVNVGKEIDEETPEASQEPAPVIPDENGEKNNGENSDNNNPVTSGDGQSTFVPLDSLFGSEESGASETTNSGDTHFDPAVHCVNPDGTPRKNKDGTFRKRPGRKTHQQSAEVKAELQNRFTEPPPQILLGMVATTLQVACLVAGKTLGEDWNLTPHEQSTLADVYARYVHYKEWDEVVTPEAVVLMTTLTILGPKILNPQFLGRFLGKRKKVTNNAHPNNRSNNVGQNNGGTSNSPPVASEPETVDFRPATWEVGQPSIS